MSRFRVSGRAVAVVAAAVLTAGLVWAGSSASPRGGVHTTAGTDRSSARTGTSAAAPTTPPPPPSSLAATAAAPAGEAGAPSTSAAAPVASTAQRFEAEELDGAPRVDDPSASGGAAARASSLAVPVQVTPGTYVLTASVKSP